MELDALGEPRLAVFERSVFEGGGGGGGGGGVDFGELRFRTAGFFLEFDCFFFASEVTFCDTFDAVVEEEVVVAAEAAAAAAAPLALSMSPFATPAAESLTA